MPYAVDVMNMLNTIPESPAQSKGLRSTYLHKEDDTTSQVQQYQKSSQGNVGGIFMRYKSSENKKSNNNITTKSSTNNVSNEILAYDSNVASEIYSRLAAMKSIVPKSYTGKSTWDRVVGMDSESVKSYVSSLLQDDNVAMGVDNQEVETEVATVSLSPRSRKSRRVYSPKRIPFTESDDESGEQQLYTIHESEDKDNSSPQKSQTESSSPTGKYAEGKKSEGANEDAAKGLVISAPQTPQPSFSVRDKTKNRHRVHHKPPPPK
jgi:hypothetical protein